MDIAERIAKLQPEKRKVFEAKLLEQGVDILQLPISRLDRTKRDQFPLSFAQERLWFIQQLYPGNFAYNLYRLTRWTGQLDKAALEKSIAEIICRHEILRTIFTLCEEKPVQVVLPSLSITLDMEDLLKFPTGEREKELERFIRNDILKPFNPVEGPLLRTKLVKLDEDEYIFLLIIHHIIADGTSIQVFIKELAQLYQAYSQDKRTPMPRLAVQYIDYVEWQRRWFGSEARGIPFLEKQELFWLEQFSGELPVLSLPYDYPRPTIQDFNGDTISSGLDSKTSISLKHLALKENTTLFKVETIRRFIEYFKQVVAALVEDIDIKISDVDILTDAEKQKILFDLMILKPLIHVIKPSTNYSRSR